MKKMKMLKGAASFYIVAFSTLILVIIATSFATVILSEVTRSMNDDLSQSAYDSALAGVEDAKLAYANYKRCVEKGGSAVQPNGDGQVTCGEIIYWMENPNCDMVGHMLGRIRDTAEGGEVAVSDTVSSSSGDIANNMNQAYTCVVINTQLDDYRASLSSSNQVKVMKAEFENVNAAEIRSVRLSWYANRSGEKFNYNNLINPGSGWRAAFQPVKSISVSAPPTVELSFVQTAGAFTFENILAASSGNNTNRGTLYLVPTSDAGAAMERENTTFIGTERGTSVGSGISDNQISASQVAKTNDRMIRNLPFGVWCPDPSTSDFMCSVEIELPEPLSGGRNDDTFMFVVTLPYAQPDTDFAMEFVCKSTPCNVKAGAMPTDSEKNGIATLKGTQVLIDSTGRANDLYRRVEVRLESSDTSFPYPYYALELLDPDNTEVVLDKDFTVTREWNNYR